MDLNMIIMDTKQVTIEVSKLIHQNETGKEKAQGHVIQTYVGMQNNTDINIKTYMKNK